MDGTRTSEHKTAAARNTDGKNGNAHSVCALPVVFLLICVMFFAQAGVSVHFGQWLAQTTLLVPLLTELGTTNFLPKSTRPTRFRVLLSTIPASPA